MLPYLPLPFGLRVPAWNLFQLLAILSLLSVGLGMARHRGIPKSVIWGVWPWAVAGGVVGAHLYYLLVVGGPALLNPMRGSAIQGGIIGGVLAAYLFLRRRKQDFLPVLDVLAPGGALAHAFTRLGCFAGGCCFGRTASFSFLGRYFWQHPAQLYEALLDMALAALLTHRLAAVKQAGDSFALYVGGYAVIRFSVQFLRDDDAGHLLFGLAHSQYMALLMLGFSVWLLKRIERSADKP